MRGLFRGSWMDVLVGWLVERRERGNISVFFLSWIVCRLPFCLFCFVRGCRCRVGFGAFSVGGERIGGTVNGNGWVFALAWL